jgi:fatty acid amide hydrolase
MSLHTLSLLELSKKLAQNEIASVEIIEALARRFEAVEPKINAFAHKLFDRAREEAKRADDARARKEPIGPLHGLPITVKESIETAGQETTLGVKARRGQPARDDAVTIKVLRRGGAIVIGKTNVSQTLLFHESDNPIWGRTNNPWNLERAPGGSSGGESAAIASGMSAAGIGSDIGGSLRVPAAFCGLATLKATNDRWSNLGLVSALAGQEIIRAQIGPMARTARDVAFLFRAADSPLHAAYDPAVPPMLTLDPSRTEVSLLRVGYYDDDHFLTPAASVRRAVAEAVRALGEGKARTIPFEPPNIVELTYLYFAALSSDGARSLDRFLDGDAVMPQLKSLRMITKLPFPLRMTLAAFMASQGEARIERLLQTIHKRPVDEYWQIAKRRTELRFEMTRAWDRAGIDAIVCPAHATPAILHGASKDFALGGCYSMLYNLLNFPAGTVAVTRVRPEETDRAELTDRLDRTAGAQEKGSAGLPICVQVVARPYREDVVLAVMIAIEDAARRSPAFPKTPIDP